MNLFEGKYSTDIIRCRPIRMFELTLFPIKMDQYPEFTDCKEGLTLMQQSLPVRYAVMPFLQALYEMDLDCLDRTGKPAGYLGAVLRFLLLALRIPLPVSEDDRVPIQIVANKDDPRKLNGIRVTQGDVMVTITPSMFAKMRPVLAEQNGLKLMDEGQNAELLEAERDIMQSEQAGIAYDWETLLYSVSVAVGQDVEQIYEWPIRKFQMTQAAIDRSYGFLQGMIVEANGGKYKQGNPWPSWKFDRAKGLSPALVAFESEQRKYANL